MKSGLKGGNSDRLSFSYICVATYAAMKSGLKALCAVTGVKWYFPVATYAAMKSGLKARVSRIHHEQC